MTQKQEKQDITSGVDEAVRKTRLVFLCLIVVITLARAFFSVTQPLTGDEAYHWEWSRSLSGGYYDHPPMTAYIIKLTTLLFGSHSEFGVRSGATLLLAVAALALYALSRQIAGDAGANRLKAERAGLATGVLVLLTPIFAALGVYMSTDPSVVCFGALSLLAVYTALTRGGWLRWAGVGVAVGLALLSKFLCLFTFAGMFMFLLLSSKDRKWFLNVKPYAAAVIALIVFSPFLLWNRANDWATFKFNLVTRQSENAFALKHVPEFIGSQMLAIGPVVGVMGVVGLVLAWKIWRREKDRGLLYLFCTAVFPLVYFLFTSSRRRVGIHWPECGWLPVLVLLPVLHARGRISSKWMSGGLWSSFALTVFIHVVICLPPSAVRAVRARSEDDPVKLEDERYGWREAGMWVDSAREWFLHDQGAKRRGVFVMSGQYGVCAALSFYMPDQPRTHLWSARRTHGEQYRFWDDYQSLKLQDAVYFAKTLKKALNAKPVLERHFTYVHSPERLSIKVDGKEVRSFYLIKCFIFDGNTPDFNK